MNREPHVLAHLVSKGVARLSQGRLRCLAFGLAGLIFVAPTSFAQDIDFSRDVRPILSERCFTCHGPDEGTRISALHFDTEDGAFAALASGGFAIVRGKPSDSKLIERVTSDHPALRMPPAYKGFEKLPADEIAVLTRWVEQGAPWASHWSFIAPQRPDLPAADDDDWNVSPVDRLIYQRLEQEDHRPSPMASREILIRRLSLDLTGLPPDQEAVRTFVDDRSSDAYEKVVDRLLESEHFGERMAVDWLDAARYADTNGYQSDGSRSMWRWRDWVVDAFNSNKSFDQFTIEQLAGDLLPDATLDQHIATAFNRNQRTNAEGGIVEEEFLAEYASDRAATTSTVWLGLTMGCARCHDHKYDPLAQKEFYEFFAFFNNIPERGLVYNFGNDEPTIKAPTEEQQQRLAELDRELSDAEKSVNDLEPIVGRGIAEWSKKLARSQDGDWSASAGLAASYDFAKQKAPYVEWTQMPDGLLRGPRTFELVTDGKHGNAAGLSSDHATDLGDVAGFDYNEQFSFSFWLKPESANGAILTRMHEAGGEQGFGFYLEDSKLRFEFTMRETDHSMRIVAAEPLKMGQWQHITLAYEGSLPASAGTRMYVDGEVFEFAVEWDDLKWPLNYSNALKLGAGGGQAAIEGTIDDLRIFRRTLSAMDAKVESLDRTLSDIASVPEEQRSAAEKQMLRSAYLDLEASTEVRRALAVRDVARDRRAAFYEALPTVMVMKERETVRPAHVLNRGAYDASGIEVQPGVPAFLPHMKVDDRASRLDLARWIVSRDHPLTARVTVNRYWQQLFGVGIVKTVDDFGSQGERPVHPELLDWLAVEFMDSGWDVKAILKSMVMSQTYRQTSNVTADLVSWDPENRLLARGPRFRLPAEMIRDQALAASGLLEVTQGGPPVKPYQPVGLWRELSGTTYEPDSGPALYRRSLYTYWKRTVAPPSMVTFDASDREVCSVIRARTNTPLQALTLMNDVTYVEAARKLAERMLQEGGVSRENRIAYGFKRVLSRPPHPAEVQLLLAALSDFDEDYQKDKQAAKALTEVGNSQRDPQLDPRDLAAYTTVASLILNLDETVTKR